MKQKGLIKYWGGFFLAVASSLALAKPLPSPQQWLERMATSAKELTYQGDFIYHQGGFPETLNVTHYVDGKGLEHERILYLDGVPREMIRKGQKLTFSTYGKTNTPIEHGMMMPMLGKFAQNNLDANYELKMVGLDRVAGRDALLIMAIPKDSYRYSYQLWLDRDSGLLLRSIMMDDKRQKVMEMMQFTRLQVGGVLSKEVLAAFEKKQEPDAMAPVEKEVAESRKLGWEASWIPEGFILKSQSSRPSPVSQQQVDALNFSDGLASFSIFVEPDETRVLSQASEHIGALSAVSKVYREGSRYFNVTVVGDIPLGAAERIAVSVRPVKNTSEPASGVMKK